MSRLHLNYFMVLYEFVIVCRMSLHGKGKGKAPTSNSDAIKEGRWHGMQEKLRSMVRGITQSFGKETFGGSKSDPWLNQLNRLLTLTFKGKGRPKECEV